jgi:hypothetical protein
MSKSTYVLSIHADTVSICVTFILIPYHLCICVYLLTAGTVHRCL